MIGDARARLALKMNERRLQLRRSWTEIAKRAGMDESNLRRIRNGRIEISDLAERGLEDALELRPGSIQAVLQDPRSEFTPRHGNAQPQRSEQERTPFDPRTASPEELAELLEQLRDDLVEDLGDERGLDEFAIMFQQLMKIRADERRLREARASKDGARLQVPKPNG